MTYEEIRILTELLTILESSEGAVLNKVNRIFSYNGILEDDYIMKVKGVIPLQHTDFNYWNRYRNVFTMFRPVIEVTYGSEVFSFVLNRQSATLVYDINSRSNVGKDVKKERYYENLLSYAGHDLDIGPSHKINTQPSVQKKLLIDFLVSVFLSE